jgi:hypothetical protein
MFGFQRLVILGVIVAGGVTAFYVVDRSRLPTEPAEPPANSSGAESFRETERSRRAQPPVDPYPTTLRLSYDSILEGRKRDGKLPRAQPTEPMPPTFCRSVEPAPKHTDNFSGPYRVHDLTIALFVNESGFGLWRMQVFKNDRGNWVASQAIDRVELVSLLTDYEPSVYVLDEMATPALARQAKRRLLDTFESLSLDAVRRGENLMWTREAPKRMFGAIRAEASCLECHANAKEGDLLGAFTYYLKTPVNQLAGKVDQPAGELE